MKIHQLIPRAEGAEHRHVDPPEYPGPHVVVSESLARLGSSQPKARVDGLGGHADPPATIFATFGGVVYQLDRGEPEHDPEWGWCWAYALTMPSHGGPVEYGKLEEPARPCPRCGSHARQIRLASLSGFPDIHRRCQNCGLTIADRTAWDPDQGGTWRLTDDGRLGEQIATGSAPEPETTLNGTEEPKRRPRPRSGPAIGTQELHKEATTTMARRRTTPIPDDTTAEPKAAPVPRAPRTFTRKLEVVLTAEERIERQESLLTALREGDDLAAEKSEAMAEFRQRQKALTARVGELRQAVTARIEKRDVQCEERFDDRRGEVTITRLDTGAVIDTRAMTADERQQWIPGTGPATSEVREPATPLTKRKRKGRVVVTPAQGAES